MFSKRVNLGKKITSPYYSPMEPNRPDYGDSLRCRYLVQGAVHCLAEIKVRKGPIILLC